MDAGRINSLDQSDIPEPTLPTTHTSSSWLIISTFQDADPVSSSCDALTVRRSPGNVGCRKEYSAQPLSSQSSPKASRIVSVAHPQTVTPPHQGTGKTVGLGNLSGVDRVGYIGVIIVIEIGFHNVFNHWTSHGVPISSNGLYSRFGPAPPLPHLRGSLVVNRLSHSQYSCPTACPYAITLRKNCRALPPANLVTSSSEYPRLISPRMMFLPSSGDSKPSR